MKTTLPQATISYNTYDFLKSTLDTLVASKCLSFYAFVYHEPEDDEGGKKAHFHVLMVPLKRIDTADFVDMFKEFDPLTPSKPLSCISFHKCNSIDDWLLYVIHDPVYLATKGETRVYHYVYSDIVTSSDDELYFYWKKIDRSKFDLYRNMLHDIENGMTLYDWLSARCISPYQVGYYSKLYNIISDHLNVTYRNGRAGHDDYNVNQDGEIKRNLRRGKLYGHLSVTNDNDPFKDEF